MDNNEIKNKNLVDSVFRLMRNIRRRPSSVPHRSRGYNRLLGIINQNDGSSSRELAEMMDIRPSSLAGLISNLEEDKVIERKRDENDQRILRVFINDAGKARIAKMEENASKIDDFLDILSQEESESFIFLCNKLSDGLEERIKEEGECCKHSERHESGRRGHKDKPGHKNRNHKHDKEHENKKKGD